MAANTQTTGAILATLLPEELKVDADALVAISTESDYAGSAHRYREQLERARQIYSRIFFEPDFANRSPSELTLAQYYISKRDWAQAALQLYTSAKNSRISAKKLPFGAELIEKLKGLNEIVDVLTSRVTAERQHKNEAGLRLRDDLAKEVNGLVNRVRKAAGVKTGVGLPGDRGTTSEGLTSQRVLSSEEMNQMLGNVMLTAESVAKSADGFIAYQN